MIENVLKMMNAPTNSDTNAKASKKSVKPLRKVPIDSLSSSATVVPVTASIPAGSTCAMRPRNTSSLIPVSASTSIESNTPRRLSSSSRGGRVEGGEGGAEEAVGAAEAEGADQSKLACRSAEQDLDAIADPKVVAPCGARVDGHLRRSTRLAPFADLQRCELVVLTEVGAERRCLRRDGLALLVE